MLSDIKLRLSNPSQSGVETNGNVLPARFGESQKSTSHYEFLSSLNKSRSLRSHEKKMEDPLLVSKL